MRCRGCQCTNCTEIKADTKDIMEMLEKLSTTKYHKVSTDTTPKAVNLCAQDLPEEMELSINYTYRKTVNDS